MDFAAWVQPYQFVTSDTLGTTVSVPVYERSKDGKDFSMEALNAALGVHNEN